MNDVLPLMARYPPPKGDATGSSTPKTHRVRKPRVVNVRLTDRFDVYVGRRHPRFPEGSPFGNPFRIGKDGTREQCVKRYEEWLRDQPGLMDRVRLELRGKVLGCWCAPLRCHGDVLLRIANEGETKQ